MQIVAAAECIGRRILVARAARSGVARVGLVDDDRPAAAAPAQRLTEQEREPERIERAIAVAALHDDRLVLLQVDDRAAVPDLEERALVALHADVLALGLVQAAGGVRPEHRVPLAVERQRFERRFVGGLPRDRHPSGDRAVLRFFERQLEGAGAGPVPGPGPCSQVLLAWR